VETSLPITKIIPEGKVITLGAVPSVGYCFDHWEGDVTGTDNPTEVKVFHTMAVTAFFVPCSQEFTSEDDLVIMTLPEGSNVLGSDGKPLTEVHLALDEAPPAPPEEASFIGPVYRLEPDGLSFNLPMGVNWSYDSAIPEGVSEDTLVVAYYEKTTSHWVALSSIPETGTHQVTASAPAEYLSVLALLGYPPPEPAAFSLKSPVTAYPETIEAGATVFIATQLANTGELEGTHTVTLKINGTTERTKDMTVEGGTEAGVVFSYVPQTAGEYQVDVDGLTTSFTVTEPPPPPVITTPEPPPAAAPSTPATTDPWYLSWPMAVIAAVLTLAIAVPLNLKPRGEEKKTGTPPQKS
jgi:hypothetical protein